MPSEKFGPESTIGQPTPEDLEEAEKPRRSLWGLLTLVIAVAGVIVALTLLRDWAGSSGLSAVLGDKTIVTVQGQDPVAGSVSLWVTDGTDVDTVLSAADVDTNGQLNLGGGRWVINVTPGAEASTIKALEGQKGIHDVGLVYER